MQNILLAYVGYGVCRLEYALENLDSFGNTLADNSLWQLLHGAWMFDTSAILYTNALYALLMLLPLHYKETAIWQKVAKWVFVVVNSICFCTCLADSVYFKFTNRRTTMSVFQEFENESNIGSIFGVELMNHWYLVLLGIAMTWALFKFYRMPVLQVLPPDGKGKVWYYVRQTLCLIIFVPLCIGGMRGGMTTAVRPITLSNANQYVSHPQEAALILNTPFTLLRTLSKKSFVDPKYFSQDLSTLSDIYTPLHEPLLSDTTSAFGIGKGANIVVLIVESFGREYIGALNEKLDGGKYKGYTPFVDSLVKKSLTFDYTFCNGRKSIDGMPSILSSIPMFVEPFFLTPAAMNKVSGIAGELGKIGYESAFFHGAENGSMGFQAFAKATGFGSYYGRTEYNADKRFGGDKDFDGTWAIWDEPFLQFYAQKMSEMKTPFVTAVFTASSHHPFVVPDEYAKKYTDDGKNVIHKCIRYTDHALERFFETASRQPWYHNTIFVLTSDHTNLSDHAEYQTDLGIFGSPIIIFDPSGRIAPGRSKQVAQQIDIMPTLLSYVGYPNPYVAFGKNLLAKEYVECPEQTWAVSYLNGIYQYVEGDYVIQFDGTKLIAVYNYKKDWMLKHNLKGSKGTIKSEQQLLRRLKLIIQSYMQRMNEDKLVPTS